MHKHIVNFLLPSGSYPQGSGWTRWKVTSRLLSCSYSDSVLFCHVSNLFVIYTSVRDIIPWNWITHNKTAQEQDTQVVIHLLRFPKPRCTCTPIYFLPLTGCKCSVPLEMMFPRLSNQDVQSCNKNIKGFITQR